MTNATKAGRDIAPRPIGYSFAALLVTAVAYGTAVSYDANPTGAAAALLAAWAMQVVAFGLLAARLRDGRDATRAWALGIGVRAFAVLAAWPLTALGLFERDVGIAFGLCLAALMILEAIWLAAVSATSRSIDR